MLFVVLPAPVLAQSGDDGGPSLSEKETARELFRQGDEAYRAGNYEEALKAFAAADDIMQLPTTGIERGRTLLKLGKLLEASEVLQRVTRIPRSPDENEVQQQARDEAQLLIDETRAQIPSLVVNVVGVPEQVAMIMTVDDIEVPKSLRGLPQRVNPGKHVVRVSAPGFKPAEREVELGRGGTEEIEIVMEVTSSDAQTVDPWDASAGSDGGDDDAARTIYHIMAWGGLGLGAVGLSVGAVTGALELKKVDEIELACQDPPNTCVGPEEEALYNDAKTLADISTATVIIGGVGMAIGTTGLVLLLTSGGSGEDAGARRLMPVVGPGYAGLSGAF